MTQPTFDRTGKPKPTRECSICGAFTGGHAKETTVQKIKCWACSEGATLKAIRSRYEPINLAKIQLLHEQARQTAKKAQKEDVMMVDLKTGRKYP